MRILQIITLSELGGAQSVVINLANKLSENHDVIVAAGERDGKIWQMLYPNVKQEHCKHLKRALSPLYDFLTIVDFMRLYRKYTPDVIHLHSSKAGMLGRVAFPSNKVVYTVHGFDSIRLAYRKFLPMERVMQRYCKAIVGVSKYDETNLKQEGIHRNVYCVYNGISRLTASQDTYFALFDRYTKIVLCIARLSHPKRSDLFMSVAELLPKYAFVWIGNQSEVNEHPDNVYFLGNIPNAGIYNKGIDLFMLASDYEGLPMVILEAMSFGKPVVASKVGGIGEVVEDGINGFTVNNTAEEFAEKIEYVLEHDDIYKTFSANALKRFNDDLTVDKMVNAYMDIYQL